MPTTYQEGIPRIIIEALACGRPVITTNVAGCNEIITNGVNGIIIPINDPVSLAEAIIKLVNNPELREIMGKKGREIFLKKYSNSIVFKYTFNTYQRLLNST
jgi:glycosyltransferase involved in cell wall biosynthesis